jgi:hypothetical protein
MKNITITQQELWDEYVFWRSRGKKDLALGHIRTEKDPLYWLILAASIIHRKYMDQIQEGDVVSVESITHEFVWNAKVENAFALGTGYD